MKNNLIKIALLLAVLTSIVLIIFNTWKVDLTDLDKLKKQYDEQIRIKDSLISLHFDKLKIDSIKIDSLNSIKSKIKIKYQDRLVYIYGLDSSECLKMLPEPCKALELIVAGERDSILLINCNEHLTIKDSMYFGALEIIGLEKEKVTILQNENDTLFGIAQTALSKNKTLKKQFKISVILNAVLVVIAILK